MGKRQYSAVYHKLIDDAYRYYLQLAAISILLGFTALAMCIMNIVTQKHEMTIVTLVFAVICFINFVLILRSRHASTGNYLVFEVSVLTLFTYFLITGGASGFSPMWICVLPACGILLLGKKRGVIVCTLMLVEMIFLLWLPLGQGLLMYQYTPEFCMRFPVLYSSFFAAGYFFEIIRKVTSQELQEAQDKYRALSYIDPLTRVPNRLWFDDSVRRWKREVGHQCGFLMVDIDRFKSLNDQYGHLFGDIVLIRIASALKTNAGATASFCRWGGEEFMAMLPNCGEDELRETAEKMRHAVEGMEFSHPEGGSIRSTVSIGAIFIPEPKNIDDNLVLKRVDEALYQAKRDGRNCVRITNMA